MTVPTLARISDGELLGSLRAIRQREREATAEVIAYLSELDRRAIYREEGYSSLFAYCTQALEYSEAGAYRRISVARSLPEHPELYEKLKEGAIHLCGAAELVRVMTEENKGSLLQAASGCSKREVERIVAPYREPEAPRKRERIVARPVRSEPETASLNLLPPEKAPPVALSYSVHFEADPEFMKLFEEVKALMGGSSTAQEVLRRALSHYLRRNAPAQRQARREARVKRLSAVKRSRHIPVAVRDAVYLRDTGRCTYTAPSGRRCKECQRLELDHIQPFALGGEHTIENLRLRCPAHNQLYAEQVYGREVMQSKRRAAAPA